MANILLDIEKTVEVAAEDALKFLTGAQTKIAKAGPGVVAGLGTILGTVSTAVNGTETAAVTFTQEVATDLKGVWPEIVAFAATLGIKL